LIWFRLFYLAIPFFLLLIFINYLGYRFKNYHIRKFPGTEHVGIGPTEGSLLGLTALLLSFTLYVCLQIWNPAPAYCFGNEWYRDDNTEMWYVPWQCQKSIKGWFKKLSGHQDRILYGGDNETRIKNSLEQSDSISYLIWTGLQSFHMIWITRGEWADGSSLNSRWILLSPVSQPGEQRFPEWFYLYFVYWFLICFSFRLWPAKVWKGTKILVLAVALITTLALYLVVDLDKPAGFVNLGSTEQLLVNLRNLFTENKWQLIYSERELQKNFYNRKLMLANGINSCSWTYRRKRGVYR